MHKTIDTFWPTIWPDLRKHANCALLWLSWNIVYLKLSLSSPHILSNNKQVSISKVSKILRHTWVISVEIYRIMFYKIFKWVPWTEGQVYAPQGVNNLNSSCILNITGILIHFIPSPPAPIAGYYFRTESTILLDFVAGFARCYYRAAPQSHPRDIMKLSNGTWTGTYGQLQRGEFDASYLYDGYAPVLAGDFRLTHVMTIGTVQAN